MLFKREDKISILHNQKNKIRKNQFIQNYNFPSFSWFSEDITYLVKAKSPLTEILCGWRGVERLLFFYLKKDEH